MASSCSRLTVSSLVRECKLRYRCCLRKSWTPTGQTLSRITHPQLMSTRIRCLEFRWSADQDRLRIRFSSIGNSARRRAQCLSPLRQIVGKPRRDRKSTRLNSSHLVISYAVFCLKKKKEEYHI